MPDGLFNRIKFGDGLNVIDEGGGTIRVDGSGGPAGGIPSGPAGGVLSGTYPNPGFAADMATQAELDAAVATVNTSLGNKVDKDSVVVAATRIVASKLLAGDTQPAFRIKGDGKIEWGAGGTTAADTSLYRSAASTLRSDGTLSLGAALFTTDDVLVRQGTAGYVRLGNLALNGVDAGIRFGSGQDTVLYRAGAAILQVNGYFRGTPVESTTYLSAGSYVAAATSVYVDNAGGGTGKIVFHSSGDTNIYRVAANSLKTDGTFTALFSGLSRTIEAGAVDSGGTGYRMLRVPN